jgi:hypothetical protein
MWPPLLEVVPLLTYPPQFEILNASTFVSTDFILPLRLSNVSTDPQTSQVLLNSGDFAVNHFDLI